MSSTAGKIVRSLSFTRRKKTQQMGSSHLGEDEGGEHSSGVRSVTHQEPSGAQGVGRRVTGAAAGAASSAGAVVRSLSFTRRKKKTSGLLPRPNPNPSLTPTQPQPQPHPTQPNPNPKPKPNPTRTRSPSDSGVPGQPHATSAWHTSGGDGAQPRLHNVNVHNDFRARAALFNTPRGGRRAIAHNVRSFTLGRRARRGGRRREDGRARVAARVAAAGAGGRSPCPHPSPSA